MYIFAVIEELSNEVSLYFFFFFYISRHFLSYVQYMYFIVGFYRPYKMAHGSTEKSSD